MSVRRLLDEMDSAELSAWLVYFDVAEEKNDERRKDEEARRRILGGEA